MTDIRNRRLIHLLSWVALGIATAVAAPVSGQSLWNVVGFGLMAVSITEIALTWRYMVALEA